MGVGVIGVLALLVVLATCAAIRLEGVGRSVGGSAAVPIVVRSGF
jgi:hypothetical protein